MKTLLSKGGILMKNKILPDVLVYIISPILIFSIVDQFKISFLMTALVICTLLYTMMVKSREGRTNFTGIVFSAVCIIFFSYKQKIQPGYETYVYNTYFLILCSMFITIMTLFNKNIVKRVYIDILKCNGLSDLNIWNILKKPENIDYFNKMTSVISIHILAMVFIRVYSMYTYGNTAYSSTSDLQIFVSVLFIVGELYLLSKLSSQPKKDDNSTLNKNIKNKSNNKRVINLNQYKNMNK